MSDLAQIDERLREIQEMLTRPLPGARARSGATMEGPASPVASGEALAEADAYAVAGLRSLTERIEELAAGAERALVALEGQLQLTVAPFCGLDSLERFARRLAQIEGVQAASLRSYDAGRATFELSLRCGGGGAR